MTDAFSGPAPAGNFRSSDHLGHLLLITPTEFRSQMDTSAGKADAVGADIVVIDEQNPANSEKISGALLFGKALVPQVKPFVNKGIVLGRMGQGEKQPGKTQAWLLEDPTEDDKAAANAYLKTTAPQI